MSFDAPPQKRKVIPKPKPNPNRQRRGSQALTKRSISAVPGVKDKTLDDMRAFHNSISWTEWWEDFFLGIDDRGHFKYCHIGAFSTYKARNDAQRRYLQWYLGPDTDEPNPLYPWARPQNWIAKRISGGWYSDKSVKAFAQSIQARVLSLEAIRESGDKLILTSWTRIKMLDDQIDASFNGRLMLDNLSDEDNERRTKLYLELKSKVLSLQERYFNLYTKANGINFDDQGLGDILASAVIKAKQIGEVAERSRTSIVVEKLIDNVLDKSHRFGVALPDDVTRTIIDVTSEEVPQLPSPKKPVQ